MESGNSGFPVFVTPRSELLTQKPRVVTVFVDPFLEQFGTEIHRIRYSSFVAERVPQNYLDGMGASVRVDVLEIKRPRRHRVLAHQNAIHVDFRLRRKLRYPLDALDGLRDEIGIQFIDFGKTDPSHVQGASEVSRTGDLVSQHNPLKIPPSFIRRV